MDSNTYKTQCNLCGKRTWYETEQQCHMKKEERCAGTLKVIDYTNINTSLTLGGRYTFLDKAGNKKRFTLGRTTGWKPCLLLKHNARSTGSSITVNAPEIEYVGNDTYKVNTYFF